MKKTMIVLAAGFFMTACGAKLLTPLQPTQADIERVQTTHPDYDLAEINEGKGHYEENCNKCHKYKDPRSHSEEEWNKIIPRMAKKAKMDAQAEASVLKYVITMMEAPKTKP